MSYFSKKLWEALTRPFKVKDNGETRKWVAVLGSLMDDAKEDISLLRRQWFVKYSAGEVLDIRGDERNLPRWYDESDEDYKKRVMGAFIMYAAGGTLPGMKKALAQIGYGDVSVIERSGPTWAHFLLSFDFSLDETMGRREWDMLRYAVRFVKPAHTLPLYLLRFTTSGQSVKPDNKINLLLTNHTSHYFYGNRRRYYPLDGCVLLDGSITLGDWMTLQILDGSLRLDGTSLLDGYTQYGANEPHIVRFFLTHLNKSQVTPVQAPNQTIKYSGGKNRLTVTSVVTYHAIRNYRYSGPIAIQNIGLNTVRTKNISKLVDKPDKQYLNGAGRLDGHIRLDGQKLHDSIFFKNITNNHERCEIL